MGKQQPIDRVKSLYNTLKSNGYELPADVEEFRGKLKDKEKANILHDHLIKDGYELPADKEEFYDTLHSIEKKSPNESEAQESQSTTGNDSAKPIPLAELPSAENGEIPEKSPSLKVFDSFKEDKNLQDPNVLKQGLSPAQEAQIKARNKGKEESGKEGNVFTTLKKTAQDFAENQLPKLGATTAALLLPSVTTTPYGIPLPVQNTDEERNNFKEGQQELKEKLANYGLKQDEESAEDTKSLVQSYKEIKSPTDLANYIVHTTTSAAGQIIPSLLTGGASSIAQGWTDTYLDGVREIAKRKGITPEEVIKKGQDQPAIAMLGGTIGGALDYVGAKGVAKAINKNSFYKSVRDKGLSMLTEGATETGQDFTQQVSTGMQAGDNATEAIKNIDLEQLKENFVGGVVGTGGLHIAHAATRIGELTNKNHQIDNDLSRPDISPASKEILEKAKDSNASEISDAKKEVIDEHEKVVEGKIPPQTSPAAEEVPERKEAPPAPETISKKETVEPEEALIEKPLKNETEPGNEVKYPQKEEEKHLTKNETKKDITPKEETKNEPTKTILPTSEGDVPREIKESVELTDREQKINKLKDLVDSYNNSTKRDRSPEYVQEIKKLAREGFKFEVNQLQTKGNIVIPELDKLKRKNTVTNTTELKEHVPLESREPQAKEFIGKVLDKAKETPQFLMGIGAGISKKEVSATIKDIETGKKTVRANNVLDILEKAHQNKAIEVSNGSGFLTQRAYIPLEDYLGEKHPNEEITTDEHVDEALKNNDIKEAVKEFTDKNGEVDYEKLHKKIEQDPHYFKFVMDLSDTEFDHLKQHAYERTGKTTQGIHEPEKISKDSEAESERSRKGTKKEKLDPSIAADALKLSRPVFAEKHAQRFGGIPKAEDVWHEERDKVFTESQIIAENKKGKKFIGLVKSSLGFSYPTDLHEKTAKLLQKYFLSRGHLPERVFKAQIKSSGQTTSQLKQVEYTAKDFKKALKKHYGKDIQQEDLTDINNALSGKPTSKELPENVKNAVETMRAQIDALSRRFIEEGIIEGDLTAKFTENLGLYLNRSYRKHDDPAWAEFVPDEVRNKAIAYITREYNSMLNKAYEGIQKTHGEKLGSLKNRDKGKILKNYRAQVDNLEAKNLELEKQADIGITKNELEINSLSKKLKINPKLETRINKLKTDNVATRQTVDDLIKNNKDRINELEDLHDREKERNYEKEAEDIRKQVKERQEEAEEKYDLSAEEVEGLINYMIYDPGAPTGLLKGPKLGSKDLGILKKRGEIAPEIRALLGEYSDPLLNYARTMTKMVNIINKHKFLAEVRDLGKGKFLFEKPTGKYHTKLASDASKTMAPLNGLYTTPEIAKAFEEFNESEAVPGYLKAYMSINGAIKYSKTVGSITTHARNIVGNLAFAMMNGHFRVGNVKNINAVLANLGTDKEGLREKYKEYLKYGVVGESTHEGDLRNIVNDVIGKKTVIDNVMGEQSSGVVKKGLNAIGALYGAEDDIFKIYAFENEMQRYKKARPEWTEEQLKQNAADIVRNTYPTYSMVPKIVKAFRHNPFVGAFVSFPAEVIRTTYNVVGLVKKELADPETRSIGIERLAGVMAGATATSLASGYSMWSNGLDDEDDEDMRKFVAPWSKNSQFIYLSDEKGVYRMIDLGYSDPHSYLKRPLIALLKGDDLTKSSMEAVGEILGPFIGEELLTSKLIDVARNQKKNGGEVYNANTSIGDQSADIFRYMAEAAMPGTVSSGQRIYKGIQGQVNPRTGKKYSVEDELLFAFTGQKIETQDVSQALQYRLYDAAENIQSAERIYKSVKSSKGTITDKELEAAKEKSEYALKDVVKETNGLVHAAIRLGVPASIAKGKVSKMRTKAVFKKAIKDKGRQAL